MKATLRRHYDDAAELQAVRRALAPDHERFVVDRAQGSTLELEVEAASVGELRRTLDDLLACLSAAERTWEGARGTEVPEPPESDEGL